MISLRRILTKDVWKERKKEEEDEEEVVNEWNQNS